MGREQGTGAKSSTCCSVEQTERLTGTKRACIWRAVDFQVKDPGFSYPLVHSQVSKQGQGQTSAEWLTGGSVLLGSGQSREGFHLKQEILTSQVHFFFLNIWTPGQSPSIPRHGRYMTPSVPLLSLSPWPVASLTALADGEEPQSKAFLFLPPCNLRLYYLLPFWTSLLKQSQASPAVLFWHPP